MPGLSVAQNASLFGAPSHFEYLSSFIMKILLCAGIKSAACRDRSNFLLLGVSQQVCLLVTGVSLA